MYTAFVSTTAGNMSKQFPNIIESRYFIKEMVDRLEEDVQVHLTFITKDGVLVERDENR